MSKKIVIALGGNALGNTPYEQLKLVEAYVLETADNYIFFAVAENAEAAADIFKSYFE